MSPTKWRTNLGDAIARLNANFQKVFKDRGNVLTPHINAWFAHGIFPDEIPFSIHPNKEKDDAFHPSSANVCARVLYGQILDLLPPRLPDMDANKNFFFGHYVHGLIQYILAEELGFSSWDDIEKQHDFWLMTDGTRVPNSMRPFVKDEPAFFRTRGFIDISRCEIPVHGDHIVDIKTVNARMFANGLSPYMLENYTAQVNMYLWYEEKEKAILLLAEKDTPHRFKEHLIVRDEKLISGILDHWEYVANCVSRREVPPCTCGSGSCDGKQLAAVTV